MARCRIGRRRAGETTAPRGSGNRFSGIGSSRLGRIQPQPAEDRDSGYRFRPRQQRARIAPDSTGKTYRGTVTQIGGATGSVLSLFPPEYATGNYVKVVQRVPVRIDFTDLKDEDPNHELRPGLSVEPKVRVKQ